MPPKKKTIVTATNNNNDQPTAVPIVASASNSDPINSSTLDDEDERITARRKIAPKNLANNSNSNDVSSNEPLHESTEQLISSLFYEAELRKTIEELGLLDLNTLNLDTINEDHVEQNIIKPLNDSLSALKENNSWKGIFESLSHLTKLCESVPLKLIPSLEALPNLIKNHHKLYKSAISVQSILRVRKMLKDFPDNTTEAVYKSLGVNLSVMRLDESDDILKFISNTNFSKILFQLGEIFKIQSKNDNFVPSNNHFLLWKPLDESEVLHVLLHGCLPLELNATSAYPKIYFTDTFSEAVASIQNKKMWYLLLAEVALGTTSQVADMQTAKILPGFQSCKQLASQNWRIDPAGNKLTADGYTIPLGLTSSTPPTNQPVSNGTRFAVPDPSQVRVRFLVQLESKPAPAIAPPPAFLPSTPLSFGYQIYPTYTAKWEFKPVNFVVWSAFDATATRALEDAYLRGKSYFPLSYYYQMYNVDLTAMKMYHSGSVYNLRRY